MKRSKHKGESDKATRRVLWVLSIMMLLSFAFGIVAFLPAEHRVAKLEETMAKYQARRRTR